MHAGKYLPGLIAAFVAGPAHAQQASPTPTPAPVRIPPPTVTTIPGVIPERFSIGTPTPVATPVSAPTPTPTPAPAPTAPPRTAAPAPVQATPTPQAAAAAPAPTPTQTPTASPSTSPLPEASPVQPPDAAIPAPLPAQPAPARPWLWALLGAGVTALGGLALWLFLRRRRPEEEEPVPLAAEAPAAAPPPPVRGPSPAIVPPPPAAASAEPFQIALQPQRIHIGEREVLIELELAIANTSGSSADAIRMALAAISASPNQDSEIATFRAGAHLAPSSEPFDLAAGAGGRMPVQLSLPREALHRVEVGGRPMFVPIVAIDLRWRGGLSIRRFAASFMLGGAGQGGKLAPIWLDRGQPLGPFAATRYQPTSA